MSLRQLITASVYVSAIAAGAPVDWVRLFPIGEVATNDGRAWRIDDRAHAERIVAASLQRAGGRELPFDYDHQTVFAAVKGVGGTAKAAGWIKELQVRDDGIWARADWTAPAAASMAAGEYRYLSPTFQSDDKGRVACIWGAALTNTPALDLGAVASSDPDHNQDSETMLKDIALALGLPETASQADVLAAIAAGKTAQTAATGVLAEIRTAAGVAADADAPAVCAAISALKTTGQDADLQAAVITLTAEVNTLKASGARKTAEDKVDAAIKAGQIVPATRDIFITLATDKPAEFDKLIGVQPVVLAPGGGDRAVVDPESITLSDVERAACAATGVSETDFLAQKKKDAA